MQKQPNNSSFKRALRKIIQLLYKIGGLNWHTNNQHPICLHYFSFHHMYTPIGSD